ncbi:hypothetical protein A1O1_05822 [Capronia coronata CBS 617.96]|uniref:Uncharacterized protein n=1 Tax=Capronia coronata CBS 617.96 TaxID=1182541 RepID=W9XZ17_9EURO|nr:uncharacterized protein A1O1_05822 [Capronia coronata CBS 617.96]EXJ85458.1 hypothetical protein A1O1_05822 [Capronia coronata CBS 617.96]
MDPATSPARRVLGEKDPNALLPTQSPRKGTVGLENAASPFVQRPTSKRPLSPVSARAGQKRKIDETNDDEIQGSQDSRLPHPMSQMTEILSDSLSEPENYRMTAEPYKSTPNTVVFSSFRPSQEETSQVEPQFEIHEEPSQQTLDTMHAITLPQNTSQLVPALRPSLNQEGSQISLSMSSLIDFENNHSSQDEDNMQMIEEEEVVKDQRPKTREDIRKEMLLEKAETLRTRLQLAIFKIQTNQVSRPFARLQIPKARSSSPDMPAISSSSPSSSSTLRGGEPGLAMTPETRVAMARARATMDPKPKPRTLSSLPMPTIAPTAFSARWNHGFSETETGQPHFSNQLQHATIPSSPPVLAAAQPRAGQTVGEAGNGNGNGNRTALRGEPKTPVRLSSPVSVPVSAGRHDLDLGDRANTSQARNPYRPGGPTSSVVKGEAANSLLALVRGGSGAARSGGVGMCGL